MDALAFLLVSLPIFFPLVEKMGYDPVWFGVVICLVTTLGAITPPIGICCYVIAGMRDCESEIIAGRYLYPAVGLFVFGAILDRRAGPHYAWPLCLTGLASIIASLSFIAKSDSTLFGWPSSSGSGRSLESPSHKVGALPGMKSLEL